MMFSSMGGGTILWISGQGFDVIPENNVVLVDGAPCAVQGASPFILSCLTPPSLIEKKALVEVSVKGKNAYQKCLASN